MNAKPKTPKRPLDINVRAASTVALATGQVEPIFEIEQSPQATPEDRHNAAVTLGKRGGQRRATNLSPEQRKEIAKKAAQARWKRAG